MHEPALDELIGELVAQPVDVHGAPLREVAQAADELSRAGRARAAIDLLALLAHHVRAAYRTRARERRRAPRLPVRRSLMGLTTSGMTSPARRMSTQSPRQDVFAPHLVFVVQRGARHQRTAEAHRRDLDHGRENAGASHRGPDAFAPASSLLAADT